MKKYFAACPLCMKRLLENNKKDFAFCSVLSACLVREKINAVLSACLVSENINLGLTACIMPEKMNAIMSSACLMTERRGI